MPVDAAREGGRQAPDMMPPTHLAAKLFGGVQGHRWTKCDRGRVVGGTMKWNKKLTNKTKLKK